MAKFIVDAVTDGTVTLRVPGANYRNTFLIKGASAEGLVVGHRIDGTIHAPAWKADHVDLGGNYVEPLFGRPRRMQGSILSVNTATNELTVQVGYTVTVKLPEKYNVADFPVGMRVGWDNIDIPVFEPAPAQGLGAIEEVIAPSLGM